MIQTEIFEAMLARGQYNEMLRFTLGNAYFLEGKPGKAIEHLQQACVEVTGRVIQPPGKSPHSHELRGSDEFYSVAIVQTRDIFRACREQLYHPSVFTPDDTTP